LQAKVFDGLDSLGLGAVFGGGSGGGGSGGGGAGNEIRRGLNDNSSASSGPGIGGPNTDGSGIDDGSESPSDNQNYDYRAFLLENEEFPREKMLHIHDSSLADHDLTAYIAAFQKALVSGQ
jgi:hypothetical protein